MHEAAFILGMLVAMLGTLALAAIIVGCMDEDVD